MLVAIAFASTFAIAGAPQAAGTTAQGERVIEARIVLGDHTDSVTDVAFSPDGKRLATASYDGRVRIWNVEDGTLLRKLEGHGGAVLGVEFDRTGRLVLSSSLDRTARLWDAVEGVPVRVFECTDPLVGAHLDTNGKRLIACPFGAGGNEERGKVSPQLFDVETGKEIAHFDGHGYRVHAAFAPDGKRAIVVSEGGLAQLIDASDGNVLRVLKGHEGGIAAVDFGPDGKTVLTAGSDRTTRLWNVATGQESQVLRGHLGYLVAASFSFDGRRVLTASWVDRTARIWEPRKGKELLVLKGHSDRIIGARFSPDGKIVATSSADKTVRLFQAERGELLAVLRGHEGIVVDPEFSPDGRTIATGSHDRTARLWPNPFYAAK